MESIKIPIRVSSALESRDRAEKRTKDLFFVIIYMAVGISRKIIKNMEKKEIFSKFVQLFHRFRNISILYLLYFI